MISVDTNLVVRLLTRDHEAQYRKARSIFKSQQIFIPDTVILETEWVLRYAYRFSADDICGALTKLFGLSNIRLADPARVANAIGWHRQGMDFSDALHLAQSPQCERLYTFDKEFSAKAKALTNCQVVLP